MWKSEGKLSKRKQVYSKECQEMVDKLGTEELVEEEEEEGLGGGEKKRRLSVDQVKALERSFEKENKLEPERKNRLAEQLGLQPRQVAIWFQNRRARRKTKQLERDYGVLKSSYDSLRADYGCLEQENKSLNSQVDVEFRIVCAIRSELHVSLNSDVIVCFLRSQLTGMKMKLQRQVRAAENNLGSERPRVIAVEEPPVSELAIVKPRFGYGSEIDTSSNSDNSIVKESEEEEEEDPKLNLLKAEVDMVMQMPSLMSVSSLNRNNASTASSGSSCTTSVFSCFQGWDSGVGKAAYAHSLQGMMTTRAAMAEEQQQQGSFNFLSVDQAPTLHCYFATDDD